MTKEIGIREAVGVFQKEADLQGAIDELMSSGFDRAEISLLASEHVVEEKLGHRYSKVTETEDDAEIPRCCYVSPESVSAAEGGLIGGLMYVGAVAAAGVVLVSGGALRRPWRGWPWPGAEGRLSAGCWRSWWETVTPSTCRNSLSTAASCSG